MKFEGLEQNPETKSPWARLARSGKKVMKFLSGGRDVANIVDGKVNFYSGRAGDKSLKSSTLWGQRDERQKGIPATATWAERLAAIKRPGFAVQN